MYKFFSCWNVSSLLNLIILDSENCKNPPSHFFFIFGARKQWNKIEKGNKIECGQYFQIPKRLLCNLQYARSNTNLSKIKLRRNSSVGLSFLKSTAALQSIFLLYKLYRIYLTTLNFVIIRQNKGSQKFLKNRFFWKISGKKVSKGLMMGV